MNLKLKYVGSVEDHHLFTYVVSGKEEMTRVTPLKNKYELTIGFGNFRTKMIIEQGSKMGMDITNQLKNNNIDYGTQTV